MADNNSVLYRKFGIASVILNAYLVAFWVLAETGWMDRFSTMIDFEVSLGRILVLLLPTVLVFGLGLVTATKDSKWWIPTMLLPAVGSDGTGIGISVAIFHPCGVWIQINTITKGLGTGFCPPHATVIRTGAEVSAISGMMKTTFSSS